MHSTSQKETPVADNVSPAASHAIKIQAKLSVGAVNDPLEHEADAMADKVMSMQHVPSATGTTSTGIQRKCAECEDEDEKKVQRKPLASFIQRKESSSGTVASDTINSRINESKGNGSNMDDSTQSFMQSRFGTDFSDVKIHTGDPAIQMNRELNAKAFTVGNDIYFNQGQYNPTSNDGKHLLAHELTHTVQQNKTFSSIQRACSAEDQLKYDGIAANIKTLPFYLKAPTHPDAIYTPSQVKKKADHIITKAKERDECLYYIQFLQKLFSTEEEPPGEIGDKFKKIMAEGSAAEKTRLGSDPGKKDKDVEENARQDIKRTGRKVKNKKWDKIYYVDASDINNIFVLAQVKLKGKKEYTDQVKQMEDGIEKAASISGYTVNLVFTERSGYDVFETKVDPTRWPTSGNWVTGIDALAHELHHLLNLPDRYNYIESHSENKKMYIADRIHWFTEEFNRTEDPNIKSSFMGKGSLVIPEDVCKVIYPANAAAETDCITKRKAMDSTAYGIKFSAFAKVQRLIEIIGGFIPATLLDARADEKTIPFAQEKILKIAEQEFGQNVSADFLDSGLSRMKNFIASGRIQMENTTDPRCIGQTVGINRSPIAFIICPSFMALSANDQVHEILRSAYRMHQEFSGTMVYEKIMGRGESPEVAKQWADFITKAADR